jgi:hypothetical protein
MYTNQVAALLSNGIPGFAKITRESHRSSLKLLPAGNSYVTLRSPLGDYSQWCLSIRGNSSMWKMPRLSGGTASKGQS